MERTASEAESDRATASPTRRTSDRDSGGSQTQLGTVARLHQSVGNQGLQALTDQGHRQTTLEVTRPGDPGEREADRVAEVALRTPESTPAQSETTPATPLVSSHRRLLPSSGRPMDPTTRDFVEARFGRDFGDVRVHAGPEAATRAAQLGARAFTVGSNIVFGEGQYRPSRSAGRRLLAHELAHVTQDRRAVQRNPLTVEEIDELLAENERRSRQQDLSPEAMDSLLETRARLLQLRSQLTSGESEPDYSLATSSQSEQMSTGPAVPSPEERIDFYLRADAFSTGLDRLGQMIDHVRSEVEREQDEWFVFSDRTFTRPVVNRILNEASPFAEHASSFLAEYEGIDPSRAERLRNDIRTYEENLKSLRAVRPEPIGGVEATGRRFVGATKGASGAFLGFLRLGIIDSWGQFISEGSEQRITEAQESLDGLIQNVQQEGFGTTVSEGVSAAADRLERAERMGQHTAAAEQFGTAAFDLYFAGRGLVSLGQGGVQMSRAASALRAAGHPTPWRGALRMAGREMTTFRGVGVHRGSGIWGSQYGVGGGGELPRGMLEAGEGRASGGGRGGPPQRGSGGGGEGGRGSGGSGSGGESSQRILVVGPEQSHEFSWARQMSGRGHNVSAYNPEVTAEARAHMARGGNFTAERIQELPREPSFNVIREDFPFPQGRYMGSAESFAAERVARLAPGGKWYVLTEKPEFVNALRAVASEMRVDLTVRQYTRFPEFHEATPTSPWPREPTRFVLVFEKPAAPGQ